MDTGTKSDRTGARVGTAPREPRAHESGTSPQRHRLVRRSLRPATLLLLTLGLAISTPSLTSISGEANATKTGTLSAQKGTKWKEPNRKTPVLTNKVNFAYSNDRGTVSLYGYATADTTRFGDPSTNIRLCYSLGFWIEGTTLAASSGGLTIDNQQSPGTPLSDTPPTLIRTTRTTKTWRYSFPMPHTCKDNTRDMTVNIPRTIFDSLGFIPTKIGVTTSAWNTWQDGNPAYYSRVQTSGNLKDVKPNR